MDSKNRKWGQARSSTALIISVFMTSFWLLKVLITPVIKSNAVVLKIIDSIRRRQGSVHVSYWN